MADWGAVVSELERVDVAACDAIQLGDAVAAATGVRHWLDALCARLAARADTLHADGGGTADGAETIRTAGRWSNRDAHQVAERGRVIEAIPELGTRLAAGAVSANHVDVVARATRRLEPDARVRLLAKADELVEMAELVAPEVFERHCTVLARQASEDDGLGEFERQRRATRLKKWVNQHTGMYVINGEFDPELGGKVFTALDREIEARWRAAQDDGHSAHDRSADDRSAGDGPMPDTVRSNEQLAAHALAGLVTGERTSRAAGAAEMVVLIDLDSLVGGAHDATLCRLADGSPIPVATARRLACEANLIPVVLDGESQALDVGSASRLATWAQRRALRAMYATCTIPDCHVKFDRCQIHHTVEWHHGGRTDLADLGPVCHEHHHQVHEGGWRLSFDADRTAHWWRPDGELHSAAQFRPLQPPRRRPRPASAAPAAPAAPTAPPAPPDAPP